MNIKELWDNTLYKSLVESLHPEESKKVRDMIDMLIRDQNTLVPKNPDSNNPPKRE